MCVCCHSNVILFLEAVFLSPCFQDFVVFQKLDYRVNGVISLGLPCSEQTEAPESFTYFVDWGEFSVTVSLSTFSALSSFYPPFGSLIT